MSNDDYSMDDLVADLESMQEAGLIEVKGINPDGDWLYGLTELGQLLVGELGENPDKMKQLGHILYSIGDQQGEDD